MRFGVLVFPGSNCDSDAYYAVRDVLGHEAAYVWHQEERVDGFDCLLLPGGFSYGDYLRAGAIARFAPVMNAVARFAGAGGPVLGICNGFQVLCEAGLLPGALRRNRDLAFRCQQVRLRVERTDTLFTGLLREGQVLNIPIAHGEGNYFADDATLARLRAGRQVVFRYCGPTGELDDRHNPNGSVEHIAGVCNEQGNVLGMMPHPERAVEELLGSTDGAQIFRSLIDSFAATAGRGWGR